MKETNETRNNYIDVSIIQKYGAMIDNITASRLNRKQFYCMRYGSSLVSLHESEFVALTD